MASRCVSAAPLRQLFLLISTAASPEFLIPTSRPLYCRPAYLRRFQCHLFVFRVCRGEFTRTLSAFFSSSLQAVAATFVTVRDVPFPSSNYVKRQEPGGISLKCLRGNEFLSGKGILSSPAILFSTKPSGNWKGLAAVPSHPEGQREMCFLENELYSLFYKWPFTQEDICVKFSFLVKSSYLYFLNQIWDICILINNLKNKLTIFLTIERARLQGRNQRVWVACFTHVN